MFRPINRCLPVMPVIVCHRQLSCYLISSHVNLQTLVIEILSGNIIYYVYKNRYIYTIEFLRTIDFRAGVLILLYIKLKMKRN